MATATRARKTKADSDEGEDGAEDREDADNALSDSQRREVADIVRDVVEDVFGKSTRSNSDKPGEEDDGAKSDKRTQRDIESDAEEVTKRALARLSDADQAKAHDAEHAKLKEISETPPVNHRRSTKVMGWV